VTEANAETAGTESQPQGGTPTGGLVITASAAKRIAALAESEGNPDLMLRVTISGGGCSGFQYGFDLDTQIGDDDRVFEEGGVRVVVDTVSMDLLNGSQLDYKEDMIGAYFVVENPNASSTCGCGTSFSI